MNELERALTGDSAAAPAAHILEGLSDDLVHRRIPGAPHSIYEELWHLAFWQQISLDNAYHLGRIVLLRQLNQAWPPASGGFTW
ncbi:MAG TPA: DinB family protein [Bryobacteraceae bacterium]|nr:DinB family protein [Bryobacteraceae bacterium]